MSDEHDKLLPIANVGRIMKKILPPNAKISKEAKETMQECASEFICFVTSEASDRCHKENRKTVNGDDICWALSSLGFDNYSDVMLRYLQRFREYERQRAINSNKGSTSSDEREEERIRSSCGCSQQNDNNTTTSNNTTSSSAPSFDFRILERGGTSSSSSSAKPY
ncbi:nuclear factor Y [Perilla frutescens var. frutescens]|nr:nuclear factor Y [Perilla frutescens var. frutescens]